MNIPKPPKRFIKKVPPSGAAPVFKLTLPHRVIHSYLSHLIDSDFEIATSADATNSWQGNIAPRRNKDRSEYTLQGWRLFAEAHQVQPGDQVSFELVSRNRLVVQVISRDAGRVTGSLGTVDDAAEPMHDDDDLAPGAFEHGGLTYEMLEQRAESNSACAAREAVQDGRELQQRMLRSPGSRQSSSQELGRHNQLEAPYHAYVDHLSQAHKLEPATPRSRLIDPSLHNLPSGWPGPLLAVQPAAPPPLFRQTADAGSNGNRALTAVRDGDDGMNWRGDHLGNLASASHQMLNLQLMNLNTTFRSLQSDLHVFESRAKRAEFEAAQVKLRYGELRHTLDRQAHAVLQAGQALEKLTDQLSAPAFLAVADQEFSERVQGLQREMLACVERLRGSLLRLIEVDGGVEHI